ncbi:MAG: biotin attachment protein [Candidatus Krumholzibacteriota bacterium]|nr:biotin attachment protein [Candidatus Krumholzibacteriota bacterium]
MGKKKIDFMITAFRDGFQSFYGARVLTRDFLPAVEAAVDAGLTHLETGGGDRFQSLYFYCNEDAFEMMDGFRKAAGRKANLQALSRGVNVVDVEPQSSDVIRLFAALFRKHGITTIRNFDALNDAGNLDFSGRAIVDAGLRHEICVTMMGPPVCAKSPLGPDHYIGRARALVDAGIPFDSICFMDATGTVTPRDIHETIGGARRALPPETTVRFHTHEAAGSSIICYQAAIEAGADAIDLSLAPVSGGKGQPDLLVMWHALRGTDFTLDIDVRKVMRAEEVLKRCMREYEPQIDAALVEPLIPFLPVPGGTFIEHVELMRDLGLEGRLEEIIDSLVDVIARGGRGTSIKPVATHYFRQAINNVASGPWNQIDEGYGRLVLGRMGKTPFEPDQKVVRIASEQLGIEPTTRSPREIADEDPGRGIDAARRMLEEAEWPATDESLFIAATVREQGIAFLKGNAALDVSKGAAGPGSARQAFAGGDGGYTVTIDGEPYAVTIRGGSAEVNGRRFQVDVKERGPRLAARRTGPAAPARPAPQRPAAPAKKTVGGEGLAVSAPMPGAILRVEVKEGDEVRTGRVLVILEAMKMETEIRSPVDGTVTAVGVSPGDTVAAGQQLLRIG